MPRRPPVVPLFATDADPAQLVEPVELIRQGGFATADRPPAQWFNWMFNLLGMWVDFLRGPSTARWTKAPASGALSNTLDSLDVDGDTVEAALPVRRLLGAGTGALLYTSVRGQAWTELTPANGSFGNPYGVCWTGLRWLVYTSTGKVWATAPSGTAGSAIDNDADPWTATTLPASTTAVKPPVVGQDGVVVVPALLSGTDPRLIYSTDDGATFATATLSSAATGNFLHVCWTGTAWVAVTDDGELYRATDAAGTWTKNGTTLSAIAREFATDGTSVLAYPRHNAAVVDWQVSEDDGVTWGALTPPAFANINRVRFLDGAWFLCSDDAPFFATANALDADRWTRLQLPYLDDGNDTIEDVVLAEGSLILVRQLGVLLGDRAEDLEPGPWQPDAAPTLLHDAAYLRGRLVNGATPVHGDALVWDAGDDEWQPASAGGVLAAAPAETYACDAGLAVRDAVRLSTTVDDKVEAADADTAGGGPCIGFVASKPTATTCVVQYAMTVSGFSGLTRGSRYYLALTSGDITDDVSAYVAGDVVQVVGVARSATALLLTISPDRVVL